MKTWLYFTLTVGLALGLALPGRATAQAPLSYNLAVTGEIYSGIRPSGTIGGTFGGIAVDGAYSAGTWTLSAYGRLFAAGIYACVTICRFDGRTLAGRPLTYAWTSQVPTWDARSQITRGIIGPLFASRAEWSFLVASWARANGLPPELQTRLTYDARTGM